nr:hypothetical protein GCM10020185_29630 [Pseudomonas brassicacearum subsp. brassicacearum]
MSQLSPAREEYEVDLQPLTHVPLERELPLGQRLWQQGWLRKKPDPVAAGAGVGGRGPIPE